MSAPSINLAISDYRTAIIATQAAHSAWQAGVIDMEDFNEREILETAARVALRAAISASTTITAEAAL